MSKIEKPIRVVSLIILITIIVKLMGFLRILFMAKVFGTGFEASAFEAAYRIPDLLFTSIGVALSTTFIPIFTQYLSKEGKKEAIFFANNVLNMLLIVTFVISIIGMIFAPYIVKFIYWGFKGEIYYTTVTLVRIMFPIIIFIGAGFTFVGILQSFREFNIPAAISLPANIINILYLILLSSYFGIYGLGAAVLIGWSTQVLIQIPALKKKGYSYSTVFSLKYEGIKKMLIMVVPIILGTSVQQINSLVNSALASGLGDSAVSALGYANYLYIVIAGLFAFTVSGVVFPSLSQMHVEKNHDEFIETINKTIKSIIYLLTPIMVGLLVLSIPFIKVLLQRGKFDYNSTLLTSSVLFYYSIGMIGFGIQEILNKAFYAVHNTKTPMKIGVIGMIINIALSLTFVDILGVGGLALAASIASITIAAMLLYRLSSIIPGLLQKNTIILFFKILISSIIMAFSILLIYRGLGINIYSSFGNSLLSLVICAITGSMVYYVCTLLFKTDEAKIILNIIKNRFVRNV